MGAVRKMAVYLGLVEDEYEDSYETDRERPQSTRSQSAHSQSAHNQSALSQSAPSQGTHSQGAPHRASSTPEPQRTQIRPTEVAARPVTSTAPAATVLAERPAPVQSRPTPPKPENYRITTLLPRSYNDARRIGEEYREGIPVIINLTGMEDADAKRIVDFSAGLVFGLRGTIERITNKVFLLSPHSVDVGAEARAQIAQEGFFTQS